MYEEMTIDDTVNIVNVAHDCLAQDADDDMRELAIAAKRLVSHIDELSRELECERALRRSLPGREARPVGGHRLEDGTDAGGRRDFLAGRPVHAGETLYLLTCIGWYPVPVRVEHAEKSLPAVSAATWGSGGGCDRRSPRSALRVARTTGADVIVQLRFADVT